MFSIWPIIPSSVLIFVMFFFILLTWSIKTEFYVYRTQFFKIQAPFYFHQKENEHIQTWKSCLPEVRVRSFGQLWAYWSDLWIYSIFFLNPRLPRSSISAPEGILREKKSICENEKKNAGSKGWKNDGNRNPSIMQPALSSLSIQIGFQCFEKSGNCNSTVRDQESRKHCNCILKLLPGILSYLLIIFTYNSYDKYFLAIIGSYVPEFVLKDFDIMIFVAKKTWIYIKVFCQPVCKLVVIVRVYFNWTKNCRTDISLS